MGTPYRKTNLYHKTNFFTFLSTALANYYNLYKKPYYLLPLALLLYIILNLIGDLLVNYMFFGIVLYSIYPPISLPSPSALESID